MESLLLAIVPKKPRIPPKVLETIVTILVELGIVVLAGVVIPTLFDRGSRALIALGSIGTLVIWVVAVIISWKI